MVEAVVGLVGVALGAALAPALDWMRQHRTRRAQHRTDLLGGGATRHHLDLL